MTKTELVTVVATETKVAKKDVDAVITAALAAITEALNDGDKVQLIGFGTFEAKDTEEKQGRNPKTGEAITIPAGKRISFKASKNLKEVVG